MKLSDAVRLGEYMVPATHGNWIVLENDIPCGACAVGRTCLAAGYLPGRKWENTERLSVFIGQTWPWTLKWSYLEPCPISHNQGFYQSDKIYVLNPVMRVISNLYECAGWSISQIADFIETIEPKEVPCEHLDRPTQAPATVS